MPKPMDRHTIPGSERTQVAGARHVGAVHPDERLEVTVRLRPKAPLPSPTSADAGGALADVLPAQRHYLTRDEFAAAHGADPQDIAKVEQFAEAHGLAVVGASEARRSVLLSGPAAAFEAAFGTALAQFEHDGGSYRGRTGTLSVPADLGPVVEGVFGLDDRPQAAPHFQVFRDPGSASPRAALTAQTAAASLAAPAALASPAANTSFTPPQLAALYSFPTGLDGTGQCIALIELGGGFKPADLKTYFTGLGLPVPVVKAVAVDGGANRPTTADSADGEVMLDIEVAAAVAPKATIAVYFAPNTSKGFLDAVTMAVHDRVNKPSVVSISWGSAESSWTSQAMTQFDQAFQAAAAMGVTVCCASGDNGSSDGVTDGKPHVDFPASSPYALGCGGTRLTAAGTATHPVIGQEVVWNDNPASSASGGGISGFFAVPSYQSKTQLPLLSGKAGRGVPDVAGDASPASGYQVRVDGQSLVIGGTSAVAPLWAGLIALMNQKLIKPVGFLNPLLYGSLAGRGVFHDVTTGNNGAYEAAAGWDACTGWGSPIGAELLKALGG